MYGCEGWTMKKAECWRIDAFELWWWRRLLRVPQTARRSNQSILKEINPEYSLERLMLKLKLQYFVHLMRRTDSFEKTLMLGKIEGRKTRGQQRMRWLDGITGSTWVWVNSGSWWWTGRPGMLQSMASQKVGHDWATELNWTHQKVVWGYLTLCKSSDAAIILIIDSAVCSHGSGTPSGKGVQCPFTWLPEGKRSLSCCALTHTAIQKAQCCFGPTATDPPVLGLPRPLKGSVSARKGRIRISAF